MARELHDTLAQGLAGVILQLEAVDSHLSRGNTERAQGIAVQAMARARSTLAEARRAIDDLRQSDTELNLEAAIRSEADRFSAATGIPCDLELDIVSKIPAPVSEQALRIISEGLTNIARHARAGTVKLQVEAHNGTLDLQITDDGCGFDSGSPVKSGHYGLIGMRERARLSGGMVDVQSKPGQGTTLRASLPLAERTAVQ
jgi:NarL family two-component system sensor histidine kinase YdfH